MILNLIFAKVSIEVNNLFTYLLSLIRFVRGFSQLNFCVLTETELTVSGSVCETISTHC